MSIVVKNVGAMHNEKDTRGGNTAMGDQGTVRVVVQGVEHTFGPNDSKTFGDDGIGQAVAAADTRLRIMDTRDHAWPTSNASILQHIT